MAVALQAGVNRRSRKTSLYFQNGAARQSVLVATTLYRIRRVLCSQGDITRLDVDSIVNAANQTLLGGGGVDGAIHDAAGPSLLDECSKLNGCETGNSKITKGYNLPARHVIHTTCLQLSVDNSLKHIAFPSVSTGIYGYPIEDATHIALDVTRKFLDTEAGDKLERTIFVVWSGADKPVYKSLLPLYFPLEAETIAKQNETKIEDTDDGETYAK